MTRFFTFVSLFLISALANAQTDYSTNALSAQAKMEEETTAVETNGLAVKANASSSLVRYSTPPVLSNLGLNSSKYIPVCNYLFKHKDINGGAYLQVPNDKNVTFISTCDASATNFKWVAPGSSQQTSTGSTAEFMYRAAGVYDMPTLTATVSSGTYSYTPANTLTSSGGNQKVKSGGLSEITTIDMEKSGETFTYGALQFEDGAGFMGGTNSKGLVGFGNLFMIAQDDAYLEGVNVYLFKKPSKYPFGAKLRCQVWWPMIGDQLIMCYMPLDGAYLDFKDIKADGEDGAWAATYDGAVAQFKFDTPIDLYGKPYFFVAIDGFGDDPSKEDFVMLMDIQNKTMSEVAAANMLAHNSFARNTTDTDYSRPIYSYNGSTGTFAIAPLIRFSNDVDGVATPLTDKKVGKKRIYRLDGVETTGKALVPGIYIENDGVKSRKIIIK